MSASCIGAFSHIAIVIRWFCGKGAWLPMVLWAMMSLNNHVLIQIIDLCNYTRWTLNYFPLFQSWVMNIWIKQSYFLGCYKVYMVNDLKICTDYSLDVLRCTVLLLGPRLAISSAATAGVSVTKAWLILAWVSTVAGNLTLIGSAANLIVAEQARRTQVTTGFNLSFWNHLWYGFPSTLVVIAVGLPLIRGWEEDIGGRICIRSQAHYGLCSR